MCQKKKGWHRNEKDTIQPDALRRGHARDRRSCHKMGTNRSNLVNMILAEKVEMRTPEQQMNDIFSGIEQLLRFIA